MRVYKTMGTILRHAPELTPDDEAKINKDCFLPYLFFRDDRKAQCREFVCTSCGEVFLEEFTKRIMTQGDYDRILNKHNEFAVCPKCGRKAQLKEMYRAKDCKSLTEWRRFVAVKPVGANTVYLLCGYAVKNYTGRNYNTKPKYNISAVYYLTPGYVRVFRKDYDYTYLGMRDGQFYEPKSIVEPFTKTCAYNISSWDKRGYSFIGFDRLQSTFLKYAPMDLFDKAYEQWWYATHYFFSYSCRESPDTKFLTYSALYPNIERLLKLGLGDFVCSLMEGRPMKRSINWDAPTVQAMFRMRRDEFRAFQKEYYGLADFEIYQILRSVKNDIQYGTVKAICERYHYEAAKRIAKVVKARKLNLTRTLHYLEKKTKEEKGTRKRPEQKDYETTAIWWTDYLDFAESLKYDLSRGDVLYPKRLKEAHDNASAAVTMQKDKLAFEKYRERYEKLKKKYEWSDGTYQILIPKGIKDIVEEGKVLSHCVGGYAERHVNGKTTILFMRLAKEPEKRLVTIEVKGDTICQNYGYKDRRVTEKEKEFIEKWIAWVRAGSRRPKKKKTASAA